MKHTAQRSFSSSLVATLFAAGVGMTLSLTSTHAAGVISISSPDSFHGVAQTHESSLNDLVHQLTIISRSHQKTLSGLSAIQEQMLLHERKMRGEGLPERHRALFSANYSNIVTAIVDDRITMSYGRELLNVHRQLLDRAYGWQCRPNPAQEYGDVIIMALEEVHEELFVNAEPLAVVPDCVRTPIIKGHQLWIEELLQWGCHCRSLSRGEIGSLRLMASQLERFEGYYKRDGHLTRIERENLHKRMIALNRELVDALER